MIQKTLTTFCLFLYVCSFAQKNPVPLTLSQCIEIALEKNPDLETPRLRAKTAGINLKQSRNELLPDLNGRFNVGINNGRSIDPFTNSYIDEQLSFSNAGLSLDATVFSGFRIRNSILRDRYAVEASEMEIEEAKQNLILDVTLAYLQALNSMDLVQLAQLRLQTTTQQIDRLKELYNEGAGNPADYTDIQGQYAIDQTNLLQVKNKLLQSQLYLASLLNVDEEINIVPTATPETLQSYELSSEAVFEDALENLATFKARELRIQAAEKAVDVSRSLYSPEVSFFAQLNTNYSSAARLFNETGTVLTETGGFVRLDDKTLPVLRNEIQYAGEEITFYDQLNNNLNSVVGVAVNLPLFNGFRAKNVAALQKIRLEESEVEYESTKNRFRQTVKQAHADMETAYNQYLILQDQVAAFAESFRVNDVRFNNGVSNFIEYVISKNNLDNSRISLANAKYEYLLRVQVLEYFRGKM